MKKNNLYIFDYYINLICYLFLAAKLSIYNPDNMPIAKMVV